MNAIGWRRSTLFRVIGLGVLAYLSAPMLIIALSSLDPGQFFQFPPRQISLHWYRVLLALPVWQSSLTFSLAIASLTALVAVATGSLAGIAIGRVSSRVRRGLSPIVVAPLVLPPIILGISIYRLFLELDLVGSLVGFVLANALLTAPIIAILVGAATLGVDPRLELASLSLGAGQWRTLTRITMPLVAPVAIAGGALTFLLTLDEVVVSVFLVGPNRVPLSVRMFLEVRQGSTPTVTAAASLLIVASVVIVIVLSVARLMRSSTSISRLSDETLEERS